MIKVTDRFLAPSRGSIEDVEAFFDAFPPKRLNQSVNCVVRVKHLCEAAGFDFALAMSRIGDETGDLNGPAIFVSDIWNARLNPGGIGVTDSEDKMINFADGTRAADAYMAHLFTYVLGESFNVLGITPADDPRFDATPKAWRGSAKTLQDLTGKWFTNPNGAINSAARGNRIFPGIADQQSGGPTVPRKIIGHVPKPPMIDRTELGRNHRIGSGRDADQPRAGFIVGSCHHTSGGFDAGNINVLETLTWGGLWDFQIGGRFDGAKNGVITQIIGDDDPVIPWANGTVGGARAPYGDAPAFLSQFGVNAVNRRLRSIENADGNQPDADKSADQIESLCFLTAWIHAEQAGQTAETFEWNMHHREFGVDHQGCPGAYIVEHVDEIQNRTKAIMRAYQYGDPLNPPLKVTYPANWKGPRVPAPPTATTTTTPAPKPPTDPKYVAPSLPIWFNAVATATFPQNQVFENRVKFIAGKKKLRVAKATVQRATASAKGARSGRDLAANTPIDILGTFVSGGKKYALAAGSDTHGIARGARILLADLDEVTNPSEKAA